MTRQLRTLYIALFLGLLLGLGAWSSRAFLGFSAPPDSSLLDGKWAKALETQYDKEFPIKRLGTNLWALLDYRLFGEGRPGVVLGREQWLYSAEEFKPVADGQQNIQDNWALVRGVHDSLARQKVRLVLAIIPAKTRLYPEFIGATQPVAMHQGLYREFQTRARLAGILAPDLLSPLEQAKRGGAVFLRTDTHWTPLGAEVAAQQLSLAIHRTAPLAAEPQAYITEAAKSEEHKGDLLSFLPLDPLFAELLPEPDRIQPRTTRAAAEGDANSDDALFADTRVPVALVGTSYSANPRWNFAGALRQALGSDLLNYAEDGRGPLLPMLKYLQTDEFKTAPPQVVIWEFPERYLPMPNDLSEFDPTWIAQLKNAGTAGERLASTAGKPGAPNLARP